MSALLLVAQLTLAQPNICGIEGKTVGALVCDPVNMGTGYTFHIANDFAVATGAGTFTLQRYFMPIGSAGGSKSPLEVIIEQSWPTGAPPGPFGTRSGEVRPVWSNDLFSFVAPCPTTGAGCNGASSNMALVFEGDFTWHAFNRTGSIGMQTPHVKSPGTPLRLEALTDGYRVLRPNGEQWFYRHLMGPTRDTHPVLLSEVRDPLGQLQFTLAYTGSCTNRVSDVVFATGGKLIAEYWPNCTLKSFAWRPPLGGAADQTIIANYAYVASAAGQVEQGGGTSTLESYSYPTYAPVPGGPQIGTKFEITRGTLASNGGAKQAAHLTANAGSALAGYEGNGAGPNFDTPPSLMDTRAGSPPYFATPYLQCDVRTDDIDDNTEMPVTNVPLYRQWRRQLNMTTPSGGSPTLVGSSAALEFTDFNDDLFGRAGSILGRVTMTCGVNASCPKADDGTMATEVFTVAPLTANGGNICSDGRSGGSPAVPLSTKNKRGWWSATRLVDSNGHMPTVSAIGMSSAPTITGTTMNYAAAGALEWATLNSTPQVVGSVRINRRKELPTSLAASGQPTVTTFDQRFIDTGTTPSGVPTRFMELSWQQGNTRIGGVTQAQYRGTFFRRARSCAAPTGTNDTYNRVLRVEGPCVISGPTAGACNGTSFPVTEFTYYDNTAAMSNRGRLQKISQYPNYTTSSCGLELTTTYANYTPEGLPRIVTDANGVATTFTFSGTLMTSKSIAGATTNYAWESDGSLRSIQYPQGNYELFCRHANSPTFCDFTQPLLPRVAWRAKSGTANGSSVQERIVFDYWSDGTLKTETFQYGSGGIDVVKNHFMDPGGRPTYDSVGGIAGGPTVFETRRFDGNDNVSAIGTSFVGAPEFCGLNTPSDLCPTLRYDRADRLTQLDVKPAANVERTCLDYDSQGNPRRIIQGCSALTDTCVNNQSTGAQSTCNSAPATDYDVDDFGQVVAVRTPWTSGASAAETRYEYSALGLVTKKETQSMRNGGTWETLTYDQLGRLKSRAKDGAGGPVNLFSFSYDDAVTGTNCPTTTVARTKGRLAYRVDTFGKTGFAYDAEGRVVTEWGQRNGIAAQCVSNYSNVAYYPVTMYTYSANGNVTTIRYPHGRTVTYTYQGAGLADRVDSISTTKWDSATSSWINEGFLVADIKWRPYGGVNDSKLKIGFGAYGTHLRVTMDSIGSATAPVADACTASQHPGSTDGTGRITNLHAITTNNVVFMKRYYRWNGEELQSEQTCFPVNFGPAAIGQVAEEKRTFTYDKAHRLTLEQRAGMPKMTNGLGGNMVTAPTETSFGYTSRSNRNAHSIDGCPMNITNASGSKLDLMNVMTPNATTNCQGRFSGPTLTWDVDGRLSRHTAAFGFWYTDFGYGAAANGSLDSVFHTATINRWTGNYNGGGTFAASTYQYYYDALNRRRLKVFPTGATEEFFYGAGKSLLTDVAPLSLTDGSAYIIEDTIWLDGAPVGIIRGKMTLSGLTSSRGAEDVTVSCSKLSDGGFCGRYLLVSDIQKKPVMMVRESGAEITNIATYDAFGAVNRIPVIAGVDNNSATQTLAVASLPQGKNWVRSRANYVVAPVNGVVLDSTVIYSPTSVPKVNTVSNYVFTNTASSTQLGLGTWLGTPPTPSGGLPGVQNNELEYLRTSNGLGLFTPLRFPGQFHDPELDLHENWNRYYDPSLGRYLSPEPLLQSPTYLATMVATAANVPTYAYAANNPIRFTDPTGLDISFNVYDSFMARQAARVQSTKTGQKVWRSVAEDPRYKVTLESLSGMIWKSETNWVAGYTKFDNKDSKVAICKAITGTSYERVWWTVPVLPPHTPYHPSLKGTYPTERVAMDPAAIIGHELVHFWLQNNVSKSLDNLNGGEWFPEEIQKQIQNELIEIEGPR